MKIDIHTMPEAILTELAARMVQRRISMGMTQSRLADRAGVGKRTVERIEAGGDTQLTTLIRLLRVLDLSDRLDQLVPEPTVSPMDMLEGQRRRPVRARRTKGASRGSKRRWTWGDEQ